MWKLTAGSAACLILAGCQMVGPKSIAVGRPNYNAIIQETSKEQVFGNLIRVHQGEPTQFLDVSEVDAAVSMQAAANVSSSFNSTVGFSGNNRTGSHVAQGGPGGNLNYSETPTIRYQPLVGQALVQQISAPITVDSLAYLFQSEWPPAAVLQLVVDRLTPAYEDYGAALNAIAQLDNYNAIVLSGYPSLFLTPPPSARPPARGEANGPAKNQPGPRAQAPAPPEPPAPAPSPKADATGKTGTMSLPNDTLMVYLLPDHPAIGSHRPEEVGQRLLVARRAIAHLWIRLLRIYLGTQLFTAGNSPCFAGAVTDPGQCLDALDQSVDQKNEPELAALFRELPGSIELRTGPISPPVFSAARNIYRSAAPVLRTRSALGVVKAAASDGAGLLFLKPDQYQALIASAVNDPARCLPGRHYYVNPRVGLSPSRCNDATFEQGRFDTENFEALKREMDLMTSRYFILVIEGKPPADAYVSFEENGQEFYIDGQDEVSKLNFTLLSQLLIMEAVPSQTAPLTPTISVGG